MKLFEVTRINKDGATGRKLALVEAKTETAAAEFIMGMKKIPKVRVFNVRLAKTKNKNRRVNIWKVV